MAAMTSSLTALWPMYRSLVGLGVICTVCIVAVVMVTTPAIKQNQQDAMHRAIFAVLPGTTTIGAFTYDSGADAFSTVVQGGAGSTLYVGYDPQGQLVGVAIAAEGQGYQDKIKIIYGYSPDKQTVIGMRVIESRETPGLGDRIETDSAFQANFIALDVRLNAQGNDLVHPVELVKSGQKTKAWQIDGITGATISSQAITDMIAHSVSTWLPRVRDHIAQLEQPHG
ncbi:FMN-binding protein [Aestuariibacter salexigens]|uniref:FMN-binding protein n=1 Tax=Aestuariibacter salexigens TaxID=226010 RepID=UPI0004112FCE|nr:FMN-binding protein [Aestuariibacter salexigens]